MKGQRLLLALSVFLSLLLQAQGVFACQLDESHRGDIEQCCCDVDPSEPITTGNACCEFDVEWQLTGSDPDDRYDALFVDLQPLLKLPPTALSSVPLPPLQNVPAVSFTQSGRRFPTGGRSTYLTTLRLRI